MTHESEACGFSDWYICEPFNEVFGCFIAPFVDGGLDCLIPAIAWALPYDAKLLASDPEKAAEQIADMKLSEIRCGSSHWAILIPC